MLISEAVSILVRVIAGRCERNEECSIDLPHRTLCDRGHGSVVHIAGGVCGTYLATGAGKTYVNSVDFESPVSRQRNHGVRAEIVPHS